MPGRIAHRPVELLVRGVDHHAGRVQQRDLVLRLDYARFLHQLLAIDDLDAGVLKREQHRGLDSVDADGLGQ